MGIGRNARWVHFIFVAIAVFTVSDTANADGLKRQGLFSLAINPIKVAMGMPNFEIDYSLLRDVSVYVFAEGLLFEYAISRGAHPDFVIQSGPRWHPLAGGETGTGFDLSIDLHTGYSWSAATPSFSAPFIGANIGVRWLYFVPFFISARVIATFSLGSGSISPGFEGLLGAVL